MKTYIDILLESAFSRKKSGLTYLDIGHEDGEFEKNHLWFLDHNGKMIIKDIDGGEEGHDADEIGRAAGRIDHEKGIVSVTFYPSFRQPSHTEIQTIARMLRRKFPDYQIRNYSGSYHGEILESDLAEATAPPKTVSSQIFYHGTSSLQSAKGILRKGLQPPEQPARSHHLTPVAGMVYLTPSLGYALIYAAGGNYIGNSSYRIPYRGDNKEKFQYILKGRDGSEERYGFIFEFSGEEFTAVQPDEDQVGELYHYILCGRDPDTRWHDAEFMQAWNSLQNNPSMKSRFKWLMDQWTTDRQKREIKDGMVAYYASGGKRALKKMPDDMKAWLVGAGLHVAHQGPLKPTACWKFDKTKIGWMNKDGSNFQEYAKKVR